MSEPVRRDALVRAVGVTKTYGDGALATPVLRGVNLELKPSELCLVVGPSGSGKTTLVSILAGLLTPTSGSVELCGVPISTPGAATRVRRERVGFIFQAFNLFPALSALDNVALVLRLKGYGRRERIERARRALEAVGLGTRLRHKPQHLSGGEKQRVAIARALACEPTVLIGDEPTAALDSRTGLEVVRLLREHRSAGCGILIVTHDLRLERHADRVIELDDGLIRADRPASKRAVPPGGTAA